jgi:DNA ligase 4
LEEELLIWNDDDKKIESFYKIRKYMKQSGRFIGIARDLFINSNKYLMIIFYDILLLDDIICIREFYNRRRYLFESLIHSIFSQTDIGNREIIDFSSFDALELLSEVFARAITRRWKGFMLKNYDDLYFSFKKIKLFIKLKKDYIPDFGDTADFAIIRGYRDARNKQEFKIGKL